MRKKVSMKKKKAGFRLTAAILAAMMILPSFSQPLSVMAAVPSDDYENGTSNVLWSTSFEEDEESMEGFLESTPEEGARATRNVQSFVNQSGLEGDVTSLVDLESVTGTDEYKASEGRVMLFDNDSSTKFYTRAAKATEEDPVWVQFSLNSEKVIRVYAVTSANDSSGRDPKSWVLEATRDGGESWITLDSQTDQTFEERYQQNVYEIDNEEAYQTYRLRIIQNNGSSDTQLADLSIATGIAEEVEIPEIMGAEIGTGPSYTWNQNSNQGWSGKQALTVSGTQTGEGAYASDILFRNLNVPVDEDTYLSYVIFPGILNEAAYDYDYTQMYMAIDLKFTDGTYLSDLGAEDQNGNLLTAEAQGDSRTLTTNQWNQIYSRIGTVAAGKIIDQVLVVFDKDTVGALPDFRTYFDDIELYTKEDTVYQHLSDYVYILRGTNDSASFSRGLTAPAVTVPNGFNFWVPCTNSGSNKMYDYQDTQLQYMTISHEPSYWVGDRGTWQFMVNTSVDPETASSLSYAADFSHDQEVAKAYYYSVDFADTGKAAGAKLEMTPSDHGAVVRAVFDEETENRNFILDCVRADGGITFSEDGRTFEAYSDHTSNGSQRMYVYGEFSTAPAVFKTTSDKQAIAGFGAQESEVVLYLATSYISIDQAKKNMELEIADKTFDQVKEEAQETWDDTLGIITDVQGASEEELISLYSSLYRLYMYPNHMSENTGTAEDPVWQYRSPYGEHEVKDGKIYINNGFWDTYRTTWAAYALFTPNRDTELLNGLVQHYLDQSWVPRWIAPGGTNSMVGTSSDVIFGDAMVKGIEFDYENAYASALRNAATVSSDLTNGGRTDLDTSIFLGYTPDDGEEKMFSWAMEGYINDFGIAQMAKILAETETDEEKKAQYESEYQYYLNRAQNYTLLFDDGLGTVDTMWLRGRDSSGNWTTVNTTDGVYDPVRWRGDYTETNGYNMSVSVPQDVQGLANLYGGREQLAEKIDSILTDYTPFRGNGATDDAVGGIHEQKEAREVKLGQYGHSNQPSHHILYMYNYAGQPWKTQQYVRDILERCYVGSTFGQGYIGDEDNGEMSGWYIFSALGFYPASMGSGEYTIGSPLFDSVTVNMDNGKTITIKANNNSKENVYVQSMTLNGEPYTKNYLTHEDLADGAEIVFEMGSEPNYEWGSSEEALPSSITEGDEIPCTDKDITDENTDTVSGTVEAPAEAVEKTTVYGDVEDARSLIDNTSNTEAALNEGTTTLVFACEEEQTVNTLTLTSGKTEGTAPVGVAVYGAEPGGDWVKLAEYSGLEFEWTQYTRPFAVNSGQGYSLYKVELTGGTSLAEIELLAEDEYEDAAARLAGLLEKAEALDRENLDSTLAEELDACITGAKRALEPEMPDVAEVKAAYNALKDIVDRIEGIRSAYEKIEAEEFSSRHSSIVNDGANIGGVKKETWVGYEDIEFASGTNYFEIFYAGQEKDAGGYAEVYLDDMTNEENKILTIDLPVTGSNWKNYVLVSTEDVAEDIEPGLHDVYLVFNNDTSHAYVANVDWFRFGRADVEAAQAVEEQISAIGTVTLESEEQILAARAAYEALSDSDRELVGNLDVLEAAEQQLASYKEFENVYGDVSSENWSFYYIYDAYVKGLMTGYSNGNFGPYDTLVRGQFAMVLHRLEGEPGVEYQDIFPDVLEDDYYADAILWGVENKIITGYDTTGLFMPVRNIQRQELAVMMYRYAAFKGYDTSARADFSEYRDADSVDAFAEEAMSWAVATGVISGKYNQTELDPQGNASREECAAILSRFTDLYW